MLEQQRTDVILVKQIEGQEHQLRLVRVAGAHLGQSAGRREGHRRRQLLLPTPRR